MKLFHGITKNINCYLYGPLSGDSDTSDCDQVIVEPVWCRMGHTPGMHLYINTTKESFVAGVGARHSAELTGSEQDCTFV